MEQFLVILTPTRAGFPGDATPSELGTVAEHFGYLEGLLEAGTLVLAGRDQTEKPVGYAILETAGIQEAREAAARDPAVSGGVFAANVLPFRISLLRGGEPR